WVCVGKRWGVSFTLHLLPQFQAIETTTGVRESQARKEPFPLQHSQEILMFGRRTFAKLSPYEKIWRVGLRGPGAVSLAHRGRWRLQQLQSTGHWIDQGGRGMGPGAERLSETR